MDGTNGKMIELLERIANAQDATNARLDTTIVEMHTGFARLDQRLDQTNQRLEHTNQLLGETNHRLGRLEGRVENILTFMGSAHRDHEDRIRALEASVFAKSG